MRLHNVFSFESESLESETVVEREFCWFGKLLDPEQLAGLTPEHHIQAEQKAENGRFRVRSTNGNYSLTIKTPRATDGEGPLTTDETTTDIDEQFFKQFLAAIGTAQYKSRYILPGENGDKWEVDVFTDSAGTPLGWVKLDYETNSDEPADFPIDLSDVLDCGQESQKSRIDEVLKLVAQKV